MFSRLRQLQKRTGETGTGRREFLRQLIHEFYTTTSLDSKTQILANLANFAYDPINYNFMKQLHLIDVFLAELSEDNEELIHFALCGLCNISNDPENREYIISLNGIYLVSEYLLHKSEDISLNALTTLYYLLESNNAIITKDIMKKVMKYKDSLNPRLKNLGTIFIQTYKNKTNKNAGENIDD